MEYLKEMENGVGIISFDVIVQSFNKGYLVEPGKYRVRLTVAGSNASPKSKTYEIDYQREWSKNEEEMLKDHIKIFER